MRVLASTWFTRVLLLSWAMLLLGCPATRRADPSIADGPAILFVENRHWSDVRIDLVRADGSRLRLGNVAPAATRTFELGSRERVAIGEQVRFVARPLAATQQHTSDRVVVRPGTIIDWRLERELSRSMLTVH